MQQHAGPPNIKLLAVIEATTVTGVAKNMLDFCRTVRELNADQPGTLPVETAIVTYERGRNTAPLLTETATGEPTSDDRLTGDAASPNEFIRAARALGLTVDVLGERFRFDPRLVPNLRRAVARHAPDIILTHQVKSHFLLRLSGLWRTRPWVAFHHGYTTTDLKVRAYNQLNRWSLPAATRVVTVCHAFARELAQAGVAPARIAVQHNAISAGAPTDEGAAATLRAQLGLLPDERVVLAVGRLSREKAHGDLLDAFAHLRALNPDVNARLVIVGDGPERAQIETSTARLGLSQRVIMTGQQSDVSAYYAIADVLALPSHSEGSPYVLLEAMAARVPVVATAVGGVPEMVTHEESALLVAPRAPQELAAALNRVLTDAPLARRLTDQRDHTRRHALRTRNLRPRARRTLPRATCRHDSTRLRHRAALQQSALRAPRARLNRGADVHGL